VDGADIAVEHILVVIVARLHQFLYDFEEILVGYDVEPEAVIAQGLVAFITYATPTSHLPHHQNVRYWAI